MYKLPVLVLSCLFSDFCSAVNGFTKVTERIELRNQVILDNILPSTTLATNMIDCYRNCNNIKECFYMSYHDDTDTCYLYSSLNTNKAVIVQQGWISFAKEGLTDACPTDRGFVYKAHVSLCFKYHTDKSTYTQALSSCVAEGTTLIKIDSEDKNNAVYNYISTNYNFGTTYAYIQGRRVGSTTSWAFDDGTAMIYMPWNTHFANIQPDNAYGQDFLLMSGYGWGTWNDASGTSKYSFVCEIVMP